MTVIGRLEVLPLQLPASGSALHLDDSHPQARHALADAA